MRRIILLLFIINSGSFNLHSAIYAGDSLSFPKWKFGGLFHYGLLVNHSSKVVSINEQNAFGVELFVSGQTDGKSDWSKFFNYPEYGLSCMILSQGSPNYIGNAYCLLPFINFHLFNNQNRFNLNMQFGIGAAYVEKNYNKYTNPDNLVVGTHLNAAFNFSLKAAVRLNKNWGITAGAGLIHLSNGAYELPNTGTNTLQLLSGIHYTFGEKTAVKESSSSSVTPANKEWQTAVLLLGGAKEIYPIGGPKYFAGGASIELSKRHLGCTRFVGALDLTLDFSDYDLLSLNDTKPTNRMETVKIGFSGGYAFVFDRLSALFQVGIYAYAKNRKLGAVYQRTALRYRLSEHLGIQIGLRNQRGKADFIELGMSYCW